MIAGTERFANYTREAGEEQTRWVLEASGSSGPRSSGGMNGFHPSHNCLEVCRI